jgi:putative spermidine/putrescine transport system ATP-binding protein
LGIANLVPAHVIREGELELVGVRVQADTASLDGACQVLVRPERVRLVPVGQGVLRADVEHLVFAGPITHVHMRVGDYALQAVVPNDGTPLVAREGSQVDLTLAPDALRVLAT